MKNFIASNKSKVALAVLAVVGALVYQSMSTLNAKTDDASQKLMKQSSAVVAKVNGEVITELEIAPILNVAPRAVAIDSQINRLLIAEAAKKDAEIMQKVDLLVDAYQRQVLADLYLEKTGKTISEGVTDADIQGFYKKNVSDDRYTTYDASYILVADADAATAAFSKITSGDKDVLAELKKFTNGDNKPQSFTVEQFPYDIGRVISKMEVGNISQPLATRNGFFIVKLDGRKVGKKPEVKELKQQITAVLVKERLETKLADLRKSASIELR